MATFNYRPYLNETFRYSISRYINYIGSTQGLIAPAVLSVVATSSTTVRVTFARPVVNNAAILCADSYDLAAGGHTPDVLSVSAPVGGTTTFIDLVTEELRQGATYTLTIHYLEVV